MIYLIPILFCLIHFVEFTSYLSRIAGLTVGYPMLGYSFQQMFFVGTRFLFIALMPLIGYMVDKQIPTNDYLNMLFACMLLASISYVIVFFFRGVFIEKISKLVLIKSGSEQAQINYFNSFSFEGLLKYKKNIFLSAIVFCGYSLGVFIAFYFALIFHEYRTTLSQLSGVINGFATVLLTFIIEPKLAKSFDEKNKDCINLLYSVLFGRFLGVAILSPLVILTILLFNK
ncbi:lipid II flippase family protein [Acinetobacter sp. YH12114]|uniref:lipid II flippase family protein n=1 Tax=Acinetobacter sp. YH12114 TaxID=2601101 RepID=UPI0015D3518F|nr:DUF2837 family protein [Acinetobacter sp. YH12114]